MSIATDNSCKTITISIIDKGTGHIVPCWMHISDANEHCVKDFSTYEMPGFPSTGREEIQLEAGSYTLQAHQASRYHWLNTNFVVNDDHEQQHFTFELELYVDLRALGWFCCDVHNHINNPQRIHEITRFMEARALDSTLLCQGWHCEEHSYRAHDGEALEEYFREHSTEHAQLYFGAEYPKTRFGHICWWYLPPLDDPRAVYDDMHDSKYFEAERHCREDLEHPRSIAPYTQEWPVNKILRWKNRGGVNAAPHPCSWWLDDKDQRIITTNITVDFIFGLFAGKLYDSLAVMGYDPEQIFYQNLWFNILNRGYKVAATAETDGNLRSHHHIGHLRQYTQIHKQSFDRDALLTGIKAGNTFCTSGPLLFVTADEGKLPGSSLDQNSDHELHVDAYADPKPDEYISWIVLYKNGQIAELLDVSDKKHKHIQHTFHIAASTERNWYVVKVYGKDTPEKKEFADIMHYCSLCKDEVHTEYQTLKQVAFTNPFYHEVPNYQEPSTLRPHIKTRIIDTLSQKGVPATIRILHLGRCIDTIETDRDGNCEFDMDLTNELEIDAHGFVMKTVNLAVHNDELADIFDEIMAGRWALDNGACYQPGQIPFEAWQFERMHALLTNTLNWDIELKPRTDPVL